MWHNEKEGDYRLCVCIYRGTDLHYASQKAKYSLQIAGSCNLNLQVNSTQDNDRQKKHERCTAFAVPVVCGRGVVRGRYSRLMLPVKPYASLDLRSEILVLSWDLGAVFFLVVC